MSETTKGNGWTTYSGVMLVVSGVIASQFALWAFRFRNSLVGGSKGLVAFVYFEDDMVVWGVIWTIIGALLLIAAYGVFTAQAWARWAGIVIGSLAIINNLQWAQVHREQGVIGAILAALIVYALTVNGEKVAG